MSRGAPQGSQDFTGDGKRVVHTGTLDSPALMFFDAPTAGHTSVWTLDGAGSQVQLLVNSLEQYQGVTLILADAPVVGLYVRSDGPWSIRLRTLDAARPWSGDSLTGSGDDVLRLAHPAGGLTTAAMRVTGTSGNTSVWAYGAERRTLLFNEIGPFVAEAVVSPGVELISVRCEGRWSIQLQSSAAVPVSARPVDGPPMEGSSFDMVATVDRLCEAFAAEHGDLVDEQIPAFYWNCPHFGPWAETHFADHALRERIRTAARSQSDDGPDAASGALRLLQPGTIPDSWWSGIAAATIASDSAEVVKASVDALCGVIWLHLEHPPPNRQGVTALARLVEGMCALEWWWKYVFDRDNYIPMRDLESWWPKYMRIVDTRLTSDDLKALSDLAGTYTDTEALSSLTEPERLAAMYSRSSAVRANPRLPADVVNAHLDVDRDLLFHPNADPEKSWSIIRAALEGGFDDAYDLSGVCMPFYNMRDDSWVQFAGFARTGPHAEILRNRIHEWCLANMSDEDEREELLSQFGVL